MRQSTHPTPSNGPIETHFAHPTASDGLIETHLARSTPSNGRNESHLAHSTASNGRNESHFTRSTPSNGRNERHGLALHAVTPWARGPAWGSGRCQGGLCPRVGGLTAQPTLDGGGSRSLGDGGGAHSELYPGGVGRLRSGEDRFDASPSGGLLITTRSCDPTAAAGPGRRRREPPRPAPKNFHSSRTRSLSSMAAAEHTTATARVL